MLKLTLVDIILLELRAFSLSLLFGELVSSLDRSITSGISIASSTLKIVAEIL